MLLAALAAALYCAPASADFKPLVIQSYSEDFSVSAARAEERLDAQRQAPGIVGELQDRLGARYAGVWFDNGSGEFVVPLMAAASKASVQSQFAGLDLAADFRTAPAKSSWEHLEEVQEGVNEALMPQIRESLVQTSLDPRRNAVIVRVAEGLDPVGLSELRDLAAGQDVQVAVEQVSGKHFGIETMACKTTRPRACGRPLRGGVSLTQDTAAFHEVGQCSAGFKAIGNGTGNRYVLTAGHCAAAGPKWGSEDANQNFHPIGSVEAYSFPGGDWGKIKANGSTYWDVSPWPSEVAHYWEDQERAITSESWSYVGEYVCHSGTKTGTSCGNVSNLGVSGTDETTGDVVNHLTEFGQVCSHSGDSGGPVFAGNTALGLYSMSTGESAEGKCDATSYYVEITEATTALGVSVGTRIGSPPSPPPPPPPPPTVQTTPATNIQEEQAMLNGTLNPNGSETTYYFDYGKTASYGGRVPTSPAGAGAGTQTMAMYLPVALQPRTRYHYRLVASNAGGISYGADHVFTTGVRWQLRNSNTGGNPDTGFWFGLPSERFVTGDWNGDGIVTGGTVNTTTGVWKLRNSNTTGKPDLEFQYGGAVWTEPVVGDWNGDGKTTVGVYDPTSNTWRLRNSNTAGNADLEFNFSLAPGAKVLSGDWNGDGISTVGLYNPSGTFKLRATNAASSSSTEVAYGGAIWTEPIVGDWDGNKTTTIGVYDPTGGVWRLRNQNTAGNAEIELQYGGSSPPAFFTPLSGDWDGNGTDTVALATVNAETLNEWRLRNTNSSGNADVAFEFDPLGSKQVTGDWDGNGTTTTGTYNPQTGIWRLRNSNTSGNADLEFQYGGAIWTDPVVGDWNGDGKTTVGVFDPNAGVWRLRNVNSAGNAEIEAQYGGAIWTTPVTGDWNGDGKTTIGVFDPTGGVWRLRNQNTAGNAEIEAQFGGAIWTTPVTGDWNGDGKTTIGVFDSGGTSNVWRLRNTITAGNADIEAQFGGNVWGPIVGDWNADGVDTIGVVTR